MSLIYRKFQKGGKAHKIVYGETLSGISDSLGVPMERLVELNKIANPDSIYANDTLKIEEVNTPIEVNKIKDDRMTQEEFKNLMDTVRKEDAAKAQDIELREAWESFQKSREQDQFDKALEKSTTRQWWRKKREQIAKLPLAAKIPAQIAGSVAEAPYQILNIVDPDVPPGYTKDALIDLGFSMADIWSLGGASSIGRNLARGVGRASLRDPVGRLIIRNTVRSQAPIAGIVGTKAAGKEIAEDYLQESLKD